MKYLSINYTVKFTLARASRSILLLLLLTVGYVVDESPAITVGTPATLRIGAHDLISTTENDEMGLTEEPGSGRWANMFFTPFEVCLIRYCSQPDHVPHELVTRYPAPIDLVAIRVYTSDASA